LADAIVFHRYYDRFKGYANHYQLWLCNSALKRNVKRLFYDSKTPTVGHKCAKQRGKNYNETRIPPLAKLKNRNPKKQG
jgi:hypothetical protein